MALADFTRANLERRAADVVRRIMDGLADAETLQRRLAAENAAGTLDSPDFYAAAQQDKACLIGAMDDMHTVAQAVRGEDALPLLDYRRYINSLLGL